MSLKAFHVFFVTVCTALCVFLAGWAWQLGEATPMVMALGVGGLLGAIALPVYGWWFLRKTKDVGFI